MHSAHYTTPPGSPAKNLYKIFLILFRNLFINSPDQFSIRNLLKDLFTIPHYYTRQPWQISGHLTRHPWPASHPYIRRPTTPQQIHHTTPPGSQPTTTPLHYNPPPHYYTPSRSRSHHTNTPAHTYTHHHTTTPLHPHHRSPSPPTPTTPLHYNPSTTTPLQPQKAPKSRSPRRSRGRFSARSPPLVAPRRP